MPDEIINRVAQSALMTFDLEDHYPEGTRMAIDIQEWLYQGIILREKEFRAFVAAHAWERYQDAFVALYCSSDAIIPAWAYMLVSTKLQGLARKVVVGDLEQLETILYKNILENVDISEFKDKAVIIKGCSSKPVPVNAYLWITMKIQGVAKSVMYGEACSSVPLFKRKK